VSKLPSVHRIRSAKLWRGLPCRRCFLRFDQVDAAALRGGPGPEIGTPALPMGAMSQC
jgi:hypothetical protein